MELRVSEQVLPGIGMRYEIDTGPRQRIYVIAHRDGRREIGMTGDGDEPGVHVALGQEAAITIAALLLGARFTVDTSTNTEIRADEVVVDVVELRDDSAAVGRLRSELDLDIDDPDAVVLAVISDTTPELIESETSHRCQAGDRIVVAARAARIAGVIDRLQRPGDVSP